MKYERLTPGVLLSDVIKEYRICVGEPLIGTFGGHDIVELIDRLVELENKIENGELIERTSEECSAVRKQAVKGFAEKLRDKEFSVKMGSEWFAVVKSRDIDDLVKEV